MTAVTQLPPPAPLNARFKRWFNSAPPQIAVEIASSRLLVARGDGQTGQILQTATRLLPEGLVVPSLVQPNLLDPAALSQILRPLLEQVGGIDREVILLVPDLTARVALLEFEQIPAKAEELDALVRFRLRKTLPFDADHATVSSQVIGAGAGQRVLVTIAERARLDEYENCMEEAGARAGMVLPSGLAAVAASPALEHACLLLRAVDGTLCSAFAWQGVLQFYRVVETDPFSGPAYDDIFPSVAFFRDFWETHVADSGLSAAESGVPPRISAAGLAPDVLDQLRNETTWAEIFCGVPAQIDADAAPAAHLLSVAGALSNVR